LLLKKNIQSIFANKRKNIMLSPINKSFLVVLQKKIIHFFFERIKFIHLF